MSRRPTAAALIKQLRAVHEKRVGRRLSDENLVAYLPISGSTLGRWKKKDTQQFDAIVEMLDDAGWLAESTGGAEAQNSDDAALDRALEEIAQVLERLVTHVSEPEQPPAAATSRQKPRARKRA